MSPQPKAMSDVEMLANVISSRFLEMETLLRRKGSNIEQTQFIASFSKEDSMFAIDESKSLPTGKPSDEVKTCFKTN